MAGRNPEAVIEAVAPGSLGAEMGLEAGDRLLEIDGRPVRDVIDYRFLTAGEAVLLRVRKKDGREWIIEVEKDFDDDLGLVFSSDVFDGVKRCGHRCVFCFVDQLPRGLRPSLYLKDDDYRLSFLHGNFISLSNLTRDEIKRILEQRLSPLYISVHTTDPELRRRMMGGRRAGRIVERLRLLVEGGIRLHTQIVLCPGWNGGVELERTVSQLVSLAPAVQSIAVVPVGVTRFQRSPALKPVTPGLAGEVVEWGEEKARELRREHGRGLLYLADEFYVLAGREVPEAEYYDDFPQLENGVGLLRNFLDGFGRLAARLPKRVSPRRQVLVVTGFSAKRALEGLVQRLNRVDGLAVNLLPVENRFFGPEVTVAGLLTGRDVLAAIREYRATAHPAGAPEEERVLLPAVMLKKGRQVFLDDLTVEDLQSAGIPIEVVAPEGDAFLAAAVGGKGEAL